MFVPATQMKKGMAIKHNGELYRVFETQHITPGNWRGMVQTKLRNLRSGSMIEHRFRSDDRVERAVLDQRNMQYQYHDATDYYFMDTETYDQIHLPKDVLGDAVFYLVDNTTIQVEFYEGRPMGIDLPPSVDLKVVETEPWLKSATVSNVNKPATLETGLVIQVPPFIGVGEVIRVDTTEGKYLSRASA